MIRKDAEAAQMPLLVESVYDALKGAVQALGGAKAVGSRLWPQKPIMDARGLLLNCLNADRAEKLDPEQVLLILRWAREQGFHQAKHWLDVETGYHPSAPADPQDEQERLAVIIESAGETMRQALATLEKLRERERPTLTRAA